MNRRALLTLLSGTAALSDVPAAEPPQEASLHGEHSGGRLWRLNFGSCNKHFMPQNFWQTVVARKPDAWIWLGDIIYGDRNEDNEEIGPADGKRLKAYYSKQKQNPDYTAVRQNMTVMGTWDDHDYGLNAGLGDNPHKAASQAALLDFLDVPANDARRTQEGVYAVHVLEKEGRKVQIILLDVRYHREKPGDDAEMLGDAQWAWLEQQLGHDDIDVRFIVSGSQVLRDPQPPLMLLFEKDTWGLYSAARERLFDLIVKAGGPFVVFLSGDVHYAEFSRRAFEGIPYLVHEITSSGMTHRRSKLLPELDNAYRLEKYDETNVGQIDIIDVEGDLKLEVTIFDLKGAHVLQRTIPVEVPMVD